MDAPRRSLCLNHAWRFHLGDIDAPLANTHIAAYMNNKAGYARGAAKTNFDDSDWREVDLPHDWSVEGEFSPDHHMDAGYLPRGVGWYRKYFRLDESDRNKQIELNFDGVATHCAVYVNGHLLHRNFCGSTPFTIDISDVATFGDALNTIAVKVEANWMEGWWYEGAGIYRSVELTIKELSHIASDGIRIRSIEHFLKKWTLSYSVSTCISQHHLDELKKLHDPLGPAERVMKRHEACCLRHTLVDPNGSIAVQRVEPMRIVGSTPFEAITLSDLEEVRAWSPASPHLYTLRVELLIHDEVMDAVETRIGFRTTRFDAGKGFFLNGQHTFLKGVCLHQDHAGVGVAVPESIERFRLLQLKSIGVNAIRCAHNPPSKTFLDLCDELGLLVMNEFRNFGSSPEHLRQLEAVVKRDRNHPSIILWSICNEEAIQGSPVAANIARAMITRLRELDPTRPVTGAVSGGLLDDVGLAPHVGRDDPGTFDVMSINYNLPLHDAYHQKHPEVPIIVSETGCTYATRGVVKTDAAKHHFAEDDSAFAPWGMSATATWEHIRARPYLAGMFVWTGIDYRGEPTPHAWPSVQSHWGLFDLCCFPKQSARLHESFFTGRVRPATPPLTDELQIELPEAISSMTITADGECTMPITIRSLRDEPLDIVVEGPARLIGIGNGDPTYRVNKGPTVTTFHGMAQILVQTTHEPGVILVRVSNTARAMAARTFVSVLPSNPRRRAPIVSPRHLISNWRMSPISNDRPDPMVEVSDQDMNTWERIDPRRGPQAAWRQSSGYAIYRAKVSLPKSMHSSGCIIRFQRVAGEVELFIDGEPSPLRPLERSAFQASCPAGSGPHIITLIVKRVNVEAGLSGEVELLPKSE